MGELRLRLDVQTGAMAEVVKYADGVVQAGTC